MSPTEDVGAVRVEDVCVDGTSVLPIEVPTLTYLVKRTLTLLPPLFMQELRLGRVLIMMLKVNDRVV